jgi:hypothetical protein
MTTFLAVLILLLIQLPQSEYLTGVDEVITLMFRIFFKD